MTSRPRDVPNTARERIVRAIRGGVVLALALAASGAAAAGSDALPFLPRRPPPDPALGPEVEDLAALLGSPVVEGGCVRIRGSTGTTTTVIWRHDIEVSRDASGLHLRSGRSGRRYRFGEPLDGGGGEASTAHVREAFPEIARRCPPPYFFGGVL